MDLDHEYLAASLSTLAALPVRLYRDGKFCALYHHTKFKPDLAIAEEEKIFRSSETVSYYMDENFLYYGLFRIRQSGAALLIGPVAQMSVDTAVALRILRTMGESSSRVRELLDYFSAIPAYPLRTFLQILCTINYFINGERKSVGDLLLDEESLPTMEQNLWQSEQPSPHNTLELEELMLSHVEYGRTEAIRAMFRGPVTGQAGIMASDTLRQQKNVLVCTATLVTRAAIRGGLDRETALALSDLYIQKAEMLTDVVALDRLNAQMVLDFTKRVEAEKAGIHKSGLVRRARSYILGHISQPITTQALSRELGLNRTYLCKLFTEETGLTVNHYITGIKMEEAKRLMTVTQKSTAEIAEYLGYSSQSYFQRVFKAHTGMTPGVYRQQSRNVP